MVRPGGQSVSVVVPAYNAAATLPATLASIRASTVRDIEIVVVDDGSSDATPAVVADLAASEPRLRLVTLVNSGVSAARNAGIRATTAPLVALLDADDVWHPDHLARHLRRFAADGGLGVSFSPARFVDPAGQVVGASRVATGWLSPQALLASNPTTTCSTLVIRRDVFAECGYFDETLRRCEDQEWLFRAALTHWRLGSISEPTVDYRMSPAGLASDLDGMHRGFEAMLERARRTAPALVARHEASARGEHCLYLARRAGQLGLEPAVVRRWLTRALAAAPLVAFAHPARAAAILRDALRPAAAAPTRAKEA